MSNNPKPDHGGHDGRDDHDPDPDNGRAVARAPTGGASLRALEVALSNVDTSSIAGRSGLKMLQFKRDGGGTWMFGQKQTVVEDGSRWLVDPLTFMWGHICFDGKKPHERLVSASAGKPMPDVTQLPDMGFEWQEQMTVNLTCISGNDAGLEVVFKTSTDGGTKAWRDMFDTVIDRVTGGQHDGNVVPIVLLEKDSYQHDDHGRVWKPVLTIVGWMPLDGPAPAPAAASPPPPPPSSATASPSSAQPRRRRVA